MPVKKLEEKNWEYRFKIKGKEYRKAKFTTKTECQRAEAIKKEEVTHPEERTDSSLDSLFQMYIAKRSQKIKASSIIKLKLYYKKYISTTFSNTKEITAMNIAKWKSKLIKLKFSENYTNEIIGAFRGFINYASLYAKIDRTVISELDSVAFHEIKEVCAFWTYEDYSTFISTFNDADPYKLLFEVLYFSGLRISELLGLTKRDIIGNELNVYKRLEAKEGKKHLTTLKTSSSNRRVLMPTYIIDKLLKLDNDSEYLFPCAQTSIKRHLDKHAKLAGVKRIRIHDLRHSHASFLINNGASIRLVSERLGHSSPSITMDVYWHILPNEQSKIISIIDEKNAK